MKIDEVDLPPALGNTAMIILVPRDVTGNSYYNIVCREIVKKKILLNYCNNKILFL